MARKKNGHTSNGDGNNTLADIPLGRERDGKLVIDELITAQILAAFFLQKLGEPSLEQVFEKMAEKAVLITRALLEQSLESLRARSIASFGTKHVDQEGRDKPERVRTWKMRLVVYAGIPEVAHVTKHFLADLVANEDTRLLLEHLNRSEAEGAGEAKQKERMKYADFVEVIATFRTLDPFLGGRPASQYVDGLVKNGPNAPKDCALRLPRDQHGRPIIPVSNIRGWIGGLLRAHANTSDGPAAYITIMPGTFDGFRVELGAVPARPIDVERGHVVQETAILQHAQPVVNLGGRNAGLGMTTYECVAPGALVTLRLGIPTRNFMTPERFEEALAVGAPRLCPRGLSNARSGEYGRMELIAFRIAGASAGIEAAAEAVQSDLSPEGRAYLEKLVERSRAKMS